MRCSVFCVNMYGEGGGDAYELRIATAWSFCVNFFFYGYGVYPGETGAPVWMRGLNLYDLFYPV